MNCKSCNTRLPRGVSACPNCGHAELTSSFIDGEPSSSADDSASRSSSQLSPSSLAPSSDGSQADYQLDEVVELPLEDSMAMGKSAARPRKKKKPLGPAGKGGSRPAGRPTTETPRSRNGSPGSSRVGSGKVTSPASADTALMPLDPAQLRHMVTERPALLEPGLGTYVDESGRELGVRFETDVGEIDLLASDRNGNLVVVTVPDRGTESDIVPGMLSRIGWVRKHLIEDGKGVRGIVLIERIEEELVYAAAAVADTVSFKTWRISLKFEDLEA